MTVVLAGGSGFLGSKLRAQLERDGHRVVNLTRSPRPDRPGDVPWQPDGSAGQLAAYLDGTDAVVNLAGENIAGTFWSEGRKAQLRNSRLLATRTLVRAVGACERPPKALISGSAVGYYGAHGDEMVTERTPPGTDFLARLCVDWEQEARAGASAKTRLVIVRSGVVLGADGGALKKMILPFKLGLGATLGSGDQYMPWIHVDDWVSMIGWLINTDRAIGAFNASAPTPVTNRDFTRTLGRVLRRPAVFHAPAFVLKIGLGELANMLLTGQRVLPAAADELGFRFANRELEPALRSLNL
ncbi:MAG: TIGR01777 family protein [Acidobacteria bacterium]|nr:TIGR01777 family protein [Acidobacteriota bacterium]MSO62128.1 TIGR01777 family protein [Acidobacteriota bacterium]